MKKILNKAALHYTSNTLWIHLTMLLFLSYMLLVSVLKNEGIFYLLVFGKLCVLFSPALLFVYFQEQLRNRLQTLIYWSIWGLVFFLAPLLIVWQNTTAIQFLIPKNQYSHALESVSTFAFSFLLTTSVCVLATEIALQLSQYFSQKKSTNFWLEKFSLEKLALLVLGILSFLLALFHTIDLAEKSYPGLPVLFFKFFVYLLQYFFISLVYYAYFMVNKEVLIPKVFKEKGLIYYCFSVAAVILVSYPIFIYLIRFLPIVQELQLTNYLSSSPFANDGGGGAFVIILLSVPVIISNQWVRQSREIIALEKEKSSTELNFLKQQINPHFFFNTLNNLYALSIIKDAQTPEVILQLSELMRYVIYKGKEAFVPLQEEVKYIEDYVQLQQIRLHKKLDFRFDKEVANENMLIPPLLFITFVENAFKHGIEPSEQACFFHISLKSTAEELVFTCKNSIEEQLPSEAGIGLENLAQRMQLQFPEQHEIITKKEQNTFTAQLRIQYS